MSYFITKGKAKYVRSKLDDLEYCKTNGKFTAHLTAHGISEADYVERFIDATSLCPHCNKRRMQLEVSTWKWKGSCGSLCRAAAIKAAKQESFSDPARRQLFIERLKASQAPNTLANAFAAAKQQMTPENLEVAKQKRRATCEKLYGDATYSNREQIAATKQATSPELKLLANQRRNLTNEKLYGSFHTMHTSTSKFERDAIELLEAALGRLGHTYKSDSSQFYIGSSAGYWLYDFVLHDTKQIVEFNGDYWHGNPKIYNADDIIGRGAASSKAADRWACEAVKLQAARDRGYEVKVVWESDFYSNPQATIQELVTWLQLP